MVTPVQARRPTASVSVGAAYRLGLEQGEGLFHCCLLQAYPWAVSLLVSLLQEHVGAPQALQREEESVNES